MNSKAHYNPKSKKWIISLVVMLALSIAVVVGAVSIDKAVNGKYAEKQDIPFEIASTREFDLTPYAQASAINSIRGVEEALDKDGNVVAYLVRTYTTGYNKDVPIEMTTTVSADGTLICGIKIDKQSETEYFGANIMTDYFQAQFEGRLIPIISPNDTTKGSKIDLLSNATISSEAVIGGVDKAINFLTSTGIIETEAAE